MAAALSPGVSCSTGLAHPLFSPSHLASKTPPPLYLAADGRRPDLPGGLAGARGGLSTSVSEGKECQGQAGWPECGPQFPLTLSPHREASTVACRVHARRQLQDPSLSSQQAPQVCTPHQLCWGRYPYTCLRAGHSPLLPTADRLVGWVRLGQGAPRGGGLSLLLLPPPPEYGLGDPPPPPGLLQPPSLAPWQPSRGDGPLAGIAQPR